ncbi:MAG: VWA domain-containing protein [Acidobacteria bacterium]|nr:VWA domain-containing protein [Acidobacteriota bacterium]MXZ71816.1 VWA domain-containing protein [Acidobacteriota bacterium]MYD72307.1 VWA domain-containing protein [Acidobacteriota bacterium]MYJ04184.1 VWA domain-containing protein [Acidobacteriota bacterium]
MRALCRSLCYAGFHHRLPAGGLLVLAAAVVLALSAAAAQGQALGQLYIEALDDEGQVVPDLTARDFIVLEDDTRVNIVSAERVGPMKVALLVDNGERMSELAAYYPARDAVGAFLDTLGPEHEVALFTIARSIQRRVDFTMDRAALRQSVEDMVLDSGGGTLLLDGIREIWDSYYEGDDTLPAMVVILTDGPEGSRNYNDAEFAELVDRLIFNGIMVNVVQLSGLSGRSRGGEISTMPEYARSIAENTGGVYETITTATGMPEWMERYAERLNTHYAGMSKRYRLRYEPPDPRGAQISAGARPGVNIRLFTDVRMEQ